MNDTCVIRFLPGADKAIRKLGRSDPDRLPLIEEVLASVLVNGWILSVHSAVIKVLDQQRQIGEIRDLGSGGYRLFFFWHDGPSARTLYITALEKKSQAQRKGARQRLHRCRIRLAAPLLRRCGREGGMKTAKKLPGIDARELFAAMRHDSPEIERAEAAMGSRLVIARNVLGLRVRGGITQTELARRVGTSQPRIAQIESAQANVTIDTLDRIAAAFGVKTATLLKRPRGLAQLHECDPQ